MDDLTAAFSVIITDPADYLIVKETRDSIADFLKHRRDDQIRICYMREALVPDFNLFDYAFGFDPLQFGDRYMRLHTLKNKSSTLRFGDIFAAKDAGALFDSHSRFCNFIYSNPKAHPNRDKFFNMLSQYKKVDSLGHHLTNTASTILRHDYRDNWRELKVNAQKEYKFSIAFENASHRGYTSEKLITAMVAGSVPIYWGNPDVSAEFNTEAFVSCHEYASFDEVVSRVIELDQNDELYREILGKPWLTAEQCEQHRRSEDDLRGFVRAIFGQELTEARRRGEGYWNSIYEEEYAQRFGEGAKAGQGARSAVRRVLSRAKRLSNS